MKIVLGRLCTAATVVAAANALTSKSFAWTLDIRPGVVGTAILYVNGLRDTLIAVKGDTQHWCVESRGRDWYVDVFRRGLHLARYGPDYVARIIYDPAPSNWRPAPGGVYRLRGRALFNKAPWFTFDDTFRVGRTLTRFGGNGRTVRAVSINIVSTLLSAENQTAKMELTYLYLPRWNVAVRIGARATGTWIKPYRIRYKLKSLFVPGLTGLAPKTSHRCKSPIS